VDLDFESPSLELIPGDTDFRHPTTPAIVNLIAGLKQLRTNLGPGFMISLVPEGTQVPGGFASYGGQFGSMLPLVYALRNDLAFVDVQDYNTPPLQGLDGEIYQSHTVDYFAATMDLLLHGFDVGGNPQMHFPPLPADKVVVGFLAGYDQPEVIGEAMQYILTGETPRGAAYKLRQRDGYSATLGAMFWTIDADQRENYRYSNLIGPQLHGYSEVK
jgi:chitinase